MTKISFVAGRERNRADGLPVGVKSSDFSEIYLFFDYDFQNENHTLEDLKCSFKDLAAAFSHYGSFDFIELPDPGHHKAGKREIERVRDNWIHLVNQHSAKANYICSGCCCPPEDKETITSGYSLKGMAFTSDASVTGALFGGYPPSLVVHGGYEPVCETGFWKYPVGYRQAGV